MARAPAKRKYNKKNKKAGKKTYKNYNKVIPTAPSNHNLVKLRYTENIVLTSLLGAVASYVYRINDLHDPNYTGTGHQSYFRDQMFSMYQFARVLWASIKVSLITDTAQVPMYVVLGPNQSGTADSDMQTGSERKGSKECYLNGQLVKTIKCSSSCDYYFGQKKGSTLIDSAYLQLSTSSLGSGDTMWYQILAKSLNSTTQNVYVKVDIEQIARFETPLQQISS